MSCLLQSVDLAVNLNGGQIEFPDEIAVTNCKVNRVFGGGGSEATVEVVFEEELSSQQIRGLRRSVRGATPRERFDDVENYVEPEVENPRETITFGDLKQALNDGVIKTNIERTGVPPEDVERPAQEGWIIDATIEQVQSDVGYRTLGAWLDELESRQNSDNYDGLEDTLASFATYNDASSTEQAAFDGEESLYQQATVRELTTTHQVGTIRLLAQDFIEQRQSAYESGELQAQQERETRLDDLDEQGGGSDGTEPDGLIDGDEIFAGDPITIEVNAIVTEINENDVTQYNDRIFTGTVTKVTETNERVVRFEAIDARYQLNNFVVSIDITGGDEPVPRGEIVSKILSGKSVFGGEGNKDLNAEVIGEDSGIPGIVAEGGEIESVNDPAEDLTLEDLLSGVPTSSVAEANSTSLTWGELTDLDSIDDNGYPERKYRQMIDSIQGTDRVLTFLEYDSEQRRKVANRTDGGILSEYNSELDEEDVSRMQDTLSSIVDEIRPYGPDKFQAKLNEKEQRRKNREQAIEDSIATFEIPYESDSGIKSSRSWGIDYYETAYQVIQELAFNGDGMIHIDEYNTIYFANEGDVPHDTWTSTGTGDSNQLPPVVKWESGDEKTEEDVIVESKYDESALGAFSPVTTREVPQDGDHKVSEGLRNMAISSASEVQNAQKSSILDRELMLDSGTITLAGHPRIHVWDRVKLDENIVNGFAAISEGEYVAKEVRHIINDEDGYVTEVELGNNPSELYEEFVQDEFNTPDEGGDGQIDTSESANPSEQDKKGLLGEIVDVGEEILEGDVSGTVEESRDVIDDISPF